MKFPIKTVIATAILGLTIGGGLTTTAMAASGPNPNDATVAVTGFCMEGVPYATLEVVGETSYALLRVSDEYVAEGTVADVRAALSPSNIAVGDQIAVGIEVGLGMNPDQLQWSNTYVVESCEVTPPALTDEQKVLFVPLCGAFTLTNPAAAVDSVDYVYGSFANSFEDGHGTLAPGQSVRLETTRSAIDYNTYTVTDGLDAGRGEGLAIDQVCGTTPPPVVNPPTTPGTNPVASKAPVATTVQTAGRVPASVDGD